MKSIENRKKMKKVLVINGGQKFLHSQGSLNRSIANLSIDYFKNREGFEVKSTFVDEDYDVNEEIEKFLWADVIIYHTPIWWFSIPFGFKHYLDQVLTNGHNKLYASDGRSSKSPKLNYGRGGLLQGKQYILTTSWNAPIEAFELEGELFEGTSVDNGPMYGFHKMNSFIGMEKLATYHLYDVMKDPQVESDFEKYTKLLDEVL